jgi:hypothetical protein
MTSNERSALFRPNKTPLASNLTLTITASPLPRTRHAVEAMFICFYSALRNRGFDWSFVHVLYSLFPQFASRAVRSQLNAPRLRSESMSLVHSPSVLSSCGKPHPKRPSSTIGKGIPLLQEGGNVGTPKCPSWILSSVDKIASV